MWRHKLVTGWLKEMHEKFIHIFLSIIIIISEKSFSMKNQLLIYGAKKGRKSVKRSVILERSII